MMFRRLINPVRAWFFNTTVACLERGHQIRIVASDRLLHQKGGARPMVGVYKGYLQFCERTGCEWEKAQAVLTGTITVGEMNRWLNEKNASR